MPTGIVNTPKVGRARDANATNSAERTGSGGKKLVQTRLPFKLIATATTTPATTKADGATTTSGVEVIEVIGSKEQRKRKLSYGSEEELLSEASSLRRSNSKENIGTKKLKATDIVVEEVIELDGDNDTVADVNDDVVAVAVETSVKSKRRGSGGQSPLVQIKLPLKSKRNRRCQTLQKLEPLETKENIKEEAADHSCSSDEVEALAVELNPQKRLKIVENAEAIESIVATAGGTEKEPKATEGVVETESEADAPALLLESNDEEKASESDKKADDVEPTSSDMDVDTDTLNKTSPDNEEQRSTHSLNKLGASDAKAPKLLTPKQQKLLEQRRKAREEKERKLQEERRQKQQEKEEREQAKKREREQKEEQRRKEREEKEEQRRKEREEKEEQRRKEREEREEQQRKRNEEKEEQQRKRNEAKEEQQRKRDEERRRKEQEKEEVEQKKKRAAESFSKFFVPKQPKETPNGGGEHEQSSCDSGPSSSQSERKLAFRPFQVKEDMLLAPVMRTTLDAQQRDQLDRLVADDDDEDEHIVRRKPPTRAQLYLNELRHGTRQPLRMQRVPTLQTRAKEDDDDVLLIDDLSGAGMAIVVEQGKQLPRMRAKYLHFADNRRPPYYGTWRKLSPLINARHPLAQDKQYFDYEIDSDCEWEEEEPGESLSASEDEKERESEEEDYEVDNEWFVPHGHLSDEELQNDDELEDGNTREAQKAKLQVLQQEFAQEMKRQTKKIKPRLLGPVWLDENGNKSEQWPAIEMYGCWQLAPVTLEPPSEPPKEEKELPDEKAGPLLLDEPLLQQLVRLVHGNSNAKAFLVSEYLEYLKAQTAQTLPSKTLVREKIDEFAVWKPVELPSNGIDASKKSKKPKKRLCWLVHDEVLAKFHLSDLSLQNQWQYTLTPKMSKADLVREEKETVPDVAECATPTSKAKLPPTATTTTPTTTTTPPVATKKKRATLLMSVPRDQQFHGPTKNALISQYLKKQNDEAASRKMMPADDVVLLSD